MKFNQFLINKWLSLDNLTSQEKATEKEAFLKAEFSADIDENRLISLMNFMAVQDPDAFLSYKILIEPDVEMPQVQCQDRRNWIENSQNCPEQVRMCYIIIDFCNFLQKDITEKQGNCEIYKEDSF